MLATRLQVETVDRPLVAKLLAALTHEDPSTTACAWGPELTALITLAANGAASPDMLGLESYLLRSTYCDIDGQFSNATRANLGALAGVPVCLLGGLRFERRGGRLRALDSSIAFGSQGSFVSPSFFKGTSDEFVELVNDGLGSTTPLQNTLDEECRLAIAKAIDLLKESGAPLMWVASAISTLYVTRPTLGSSRSGSWDRHLGLSYFSHRTDPYSIADALVHEASHQNFYLGNLDGELGDDDGVLRLSPAVNRGRPLWAILLAYHAFTNVAVFFSKQNDLSVGDRARYAAKSVDYAKQLQAILEDAPLGLPLSRDVFDVLREIFQGALMHL